MHSINIHKSDLSVIFVALRINTECVSKNLRHGAGTEMIRWCRARTFFPRVRFTADIGESWVSELIERSRFTPFHCLFTSQGEKVHQISKNAMGWDDLDDTSGVGFHLKTHMLHGAGIFTNIYPINHPNVGKYTIHGAYGKCVDTSGDHP